MPCILLKVENTVLSLYFFIYIHTLWLPRIDLYTHYLDLIIASFSGGDDFFMLPGSGSCYHLSSIKRTWMQAKADCEARGAMLFCPETEEEFTVVRNFLKTRELSLF